MLTTPELAQAIVDSALSYAIFTLDFEGLILSWSPGAQNVVGFTSEEAIGAPFATIFLASDQEAGAHDREIRNAIENGRAEDTRWHRRKNGERFWANGVTMRVDGQPWLLKILRDETPAKLAEDQRVLLLNELNHRIKNTLTTVQSIVSQTLRGASVDPAVGDRLSDRLLALSEAHNLLVDQSWAGADLAAVISTMVRTHEAGRFHIEGPEVRLSANQAVPLSLALHELATNALKYGALTGATGGHVRLSWNLSYDTAGGRHLTLLWEEVDGPLVSTPTVEGFGARLLSRIFAPAGEALLTYPPEGVRCTITLALSSPDELPRMDVEGDPRRKI